MAIKQVRVDKRDYLRSLLTDTAPYDLPIIFSNDGMYWNTKNINSHTVLLSKKLVDFAIGKTDKPQANKAGNWTRPFSYKIKTSGAADKLRNIELIHPKSQLQFAKFYRDYASTLLDWCEKSPYSIRSPRELTPSFYIQSKFRKKLRKRASIDIGISQNVFSSNSGSFFRYRGYSRIYKFFESKKFRELESKFPIMCELDVSNCFGNIYTHSLSWATKTKPYSKANLIYKAQVASQLDVLMQFSNDGETVGIPVGAETSRIFAEVIFQKIDLVVLSTLKSDHGLILDVDYSISRYVDDYIVFCRSKHDAKKISHVVSIALQKYKLSLNDRKTKIHERPIVTSVSKLNHGLKIALDYFNQSTLSRDEDDKFTVRKIHSKAGFEKSFLNLVKLACNGSEEGMERAAAFLVPTLASRAENFVHHYDRKSDEAEQTAKKIAAILQFCISVQIYLCQSSGRDSACDRLASSIILADEFIEAHLNTRIHQHRDFVTTAVQKYVLGMDYSLRKNGVIPIGVLSLLCAIRPNNAGSRISDRVFEQFLQPPSELSYLEIVSFLYCWRDLDCYSESRMKIERIIRVKFSGVSNISSDSELTHLLLDCVSCPYLSPSLREELVAQIYDEYFPSLGQTSEQIKADLTSHTGNFWFVNWYEPDLYSRILRKQYRASY